MRGTHFSKETISEILLHYDGFIKEGLPKTQAYKQTAAALELDWKSVAAVTYRFRSTVDLGKALLKSHAAKMAMKVIRHGTVQEHIDVLSRPGIGVLEPAQKGNIGGGGFFLAIDVGTCGAVKVRASDSLPLTAPSLQLEGLHEHQEAVIDVRPQHHGEGSGHGPSQARSQTLIEQAKARLAAARRAKDQGIQGRHEESQGADA